MRNPIDVHVGARLRFLRSERGISQGELGRRVGVTFQQIQKYERGANRISASKLFEFARILDVSIHDFFVGLSRESKPKDASAKTTREPTRLDHDIFRMASHLEDGPVKRSLRDVLRAIAGADEPPG